MPREFGLILEDTQQDKKLLVLTPEWDQYYKDFEKYKYSRLEFAQQFCQRPISAKDLESYKISFSWGFGDHDRYIYTEEYIDSVSLFLEADIQAEDTLRPDVRIGMWIYLYDEEGRLIIDQEKLQSAIHEVQEMARAKANGDEAPSVRVTESKGCHGIKPSLDNIIKFAEWRLFYHTPFLLLLNHVQGILGRNLNLNCLGDEFESFAGEWRSIESFQAYYVEDPEYKRCLTDYFILPYNSECPLYCYHKEFAYEEFDDTRLHGE